MAARLLFPLQAGWGSLARSEQVAGGAIKAPDGVAEHRSSSQGSPRRVADRRLRFAQFAMRRPAAGAGAAGNPIPDSPAALPLLPAAPGPAAQHWRGGTRLPVSGPAWPREEDERGICAAGTQGATVWEVPRWKEE
jgi:hypothetical protein